MNQQWPTEAAGAALGVALVAVLAAATVSDLRRRVIPNWVLASGAVTCLAIVVPTDPGTLPERLAAALAAAGFLMLGTIADRSAMGMGDVKLAGVIGLYLGVAVAPAMLVAFATGALAGLVLILRHGPAARRRSLAFAPFLALGGLVGLWAGAGLVDWYLGGLVS